MDLLPGQSSQHAGQQSSSSQTIVEEKFKQQNGEIGIRRYLKGKFLGKGGFAKCFEFVNAETMFVHAAKVIQKSSLTKSRAKQKLMSEIKIHRSIKHANVCHFQHFFEDSENVYILLELCQNQSMNELLKRRKRLHELEVQCYTAQIINSLKYLHSHRIIHRDLKLGNLFLNDKMEIKLGDFGLATKLDFDGEKKRTICGTPNYIAPEVLEGKSGHSYEVDIWSLGVIIYTLIIGKPPFETTDVKATYRRIRQNSYSFPDHINISDAARDLIQRILTGDPKRRPNLDEILQHEFLNHAGTIPKQLPQSFLACPPSAQYVRQFLPPGYDRSQTNYSTGGGGGYLPRRLEATAPADSGKRAMSGTGNRIVASSSSAIPTAQTAMYQERNHNNYQSKQSLNTLHTDGRGSTQPFSTKGSAQQPPQMLVQPNMPVQHYATSGTSGPGQTSQQVPPARQGSASNVAPHIVKIKRPASRDLMSNPSAQMNYQGSSTGIGGPGSSASLPQMPQQVIQQNVLTPQQLAQQQQLAQASANTVWVTKWVDYSTKYGLGYLLSDNSAGVFFNDSTKIVAEDKGACFYYYERKAISSSEKQDVLTKYQFNEFPKELQKKVTLLEHFKSYLQSSTAQQSASHKHAEMENLGHGTDDGKGSQKPPAGSVYVKKWMRTRHAIMFRLSNKIVQVNFQDHTEILLNSDNRLVTYVNKKGERSIMPLSQALDSQNQEMTKRLKYTKDILTHMLNNNGPSTNAAGGQPNTAKVQVNPSSMRTGGTAPGNPSNSGAPMTAAIGSRRSEQRLVSASSLDRRAQYVSEAGRLN